jgi:hypothetical protein
MESFHVESINYVALPNSLKGSEFFPLDLQLLYGPSPYQGKRSGLKGEHYL